VKRLRFPHQLSLLFLVLLLGACVSSLPVDAPVATTPPDVPAIASEETPVLPKPTETTVVLETSEAPILIEVQQPISQTEPVFVAEASPAPPPTPSPPPPPPQPEALEPDNVRDLTLDFLQGAYQVGLPDSASFDAVPINQEAISDITLAASYSKASWLVSVGDIQHQGSMATRPVIITNDSAGVRWKGEVNEFGIVNTTMALGLPKSDPLRVRGWVGQIVKLPAGGAYDDYFFSEGQGSHGIDSLDPAVLAELERYQDQPGLVKVFGVLLYGADDYNGRQLLINQIEHRDGPTPPPLPESTERSDPTGDLAAPTPTPFFGPTGALANGLPGSILRDSVHVSGQAEAVFENKVIVQIEDEQSNVLGQGLVQLTPPDNGAGGTFDIDVAFENPPAAGEGRIALYSEYPADGSLMLLTWANIRYAGTSSEQEASILAPAEGEVIKRIVVVQGVAPGLPNSEILIQVEDLTGSVWGKTKTQTNNVGDWATKLKFRNPRTARPGRIAVYETNPIDNTLTLLTFQDVRLIE